MLDDLDEVIDDFVKHRQGQVGRNLSQVPGDLLQELGVVTAPAR